MYGIPTRYETVKRLYPKEQTALEESIGNGDPLNFMPNKFTEKDEMTWHYVQGKREKSVKYVLHAFGCLETGVKVCLDISGIYPSFDVRIPDGKDHGSVLIDLNKITYNATGSENFTSEEILAKQGFGYRSDLVKYAHLEFHDTRTRRGALEAIRNAGFETACDDKPFKRYYRKVLRDYGLTGADWLKIRNYTVADGDGGVFKRLALDINDIGVIADPLDEKQQAVAMRIKMKNPFLAKDKTLLMTWDIETEDLAQPGIVPEGASPTSSVFMVCSTFHWIDSEEPIESICVTYLDSEPGDDWRTVKCDDERGVLEATMEMIHSMSPDIIVGFNDGAYDWPFVLAKLQKYDIELEFYKQCSGLAIPNWSKLEYVRRDMLLENRKIKIDAETDMFITCPDVPGIICVDSRIQMIQSLPPTPKQSLNFFLEYHNLPLKVDMPYNQMFKIVKNRDVAGMKKVAEYCIVDAMSCQRLLLRRNVVREKREVARISFISLDDAIFYAGGLRVCNILHTVARKVGIKCTNIGKQDTVSEKYPGAWVFDPIKGIHKDRPITGLDFSSLYPSVIITYNMSPETFVATRDEAERLIAQGFDLHHAKFKFGGGDVEGWFIRHGNDTEKFGLYPKILKDMFDKRRAMKKQLWVYTSLKEKMDKITSEKWEITEELLEKEGILSEIEDLDRENPLDDEFKKFYDANAFKRSLLDAKQKAFKVLMNTFYGEAGNSRSPFFLLQLAGGVTSMGQYNIKMVSNYIQELGYKVMYGDTDSVYVVCPEAVYAEVDKRYGDGEISKLEYWTEMVTLTMEDIAVLRDKVNSMLAADNGTPYLNVAYEEVLFPTVLTGKKKYFGIAHIKIPNFRPKDPFIKGIDVVKRNQCKFVVNMGMQVIWKALSIDTGNDMKSIVFEMIQSALTGTSDIRDFVLIDTFREHKDNKSVHRFVNRMREEHAKDLAENERRHKLYEAVAEGGSDGPAKRDLELLQLIHTPPDPGERFEYVIVAKPEIDERGRMIKSSKGDKMEYVDVVAKNGLQLDKSYYIEKYLAGLFARFIVVDEMFRAETDKQEIAMAKKYIIGKTKEFLHRTKEDMATRRKAISRKFKEKQKAYEQTAGSVGAGDIHATLQHKKTLDELLRNASERAESVVATDPQTIVANVRKTMGMSYCSLAHSLDPMAKRCRVGKIKHLRLRRAIEKERNLFVAKFEQLAAELGSIQDQLEKTADAGRPAETVANIYKEHIGTNRTLAEMKEAGINYIVALANLKEFESIMSALRDRRDKEQKHVSAIDRDEIEALIRKHDN